MATRANIENLAKVLIFLTEETGRIIQKEQIAITILLSVKNATKGDNFESDAATPNRALITPGTVSPIITV